jgi:hypothetical protein
VVGPISLRTTQQLPVDASLVFAHLESNGGFSSPDVALK